MTDKDLEAGEVAEYSAAHPPINPKHVTVSNDQYMVTGVDVKCDQCGRSMKPSFSEAVCERCLLAAQER